MLSVFVMLPEFLKTALTPYLKGLEQVYEIRCRVNCPVFLETSRGELMLRVDNKPYVLTETQMQNLLACLCNHSVYAYEDELKQGFFTLEGGHRVGVAGQVIPEGKNVRNLKYIGFIAIRISHQMKGVARPVLPFLYEGEQVRNTLIISPPGGGKTTMLRDLVRLISGGSGFGAGVNVGLVDERMELAGCYMGVPQNDVGIRTDVLQGCSKAIGIQMLLRSMTPAVIGVDEIGTEEDFDALFKASCWGISLVATMHGKSVHDYIKRFDIAGENIGERMLFSRFMVLEKNRHGFVIKEILDGSFRKLT